MKSLRLKPIFFTLVYGFVIAYVSFFHELWRDEAHTIGLVKESGSIPQLFQNLHNYGHPALWYLIIYAAFHIFKSTVVLKLASFVIAVTTMYIFLLKAPFSWPKKILFMLGYFPVYQYSVISRSYGLMMLFMVVFFALYEERFKKFIAVSVLLFLMANTISHGIVIASAILFSLVLEFLMNRNILTKELSIRRFVAGISIVLCGVALSISQIIPDPSTQMTKLYSLESNRIISSILRAVFYPGDFFYCILGFVSPFLATAVIFLLYFCFIRKPYLLIILFLTVVGLSLISALVYPGAIRHQGFLYFVIMGIYWVTETNKKPSFLRNKLFYAILIPLFVFGYMAVMKDLKTPYSSSKNFSDLLKNDPRFKEVVLIGEPDCNMESLAYYTDNPIYLPREERFGNTVRFTDKSEAHFTLGQLLLSSEDVRKRTRKPVLVAIEYSLDPDGPYEFSGYFGRSFSFTREELIEFSSKTEKIAGFRNAMNENYDVYLLK